MRDEPLAGAAAFTDTLEVRLFYFDLTTEQR